MIFSSVCFGAFYVCWGGLVQDILEWALVPTYRREKFSIIAVCLLLGTVYIFRLNLGFIHSGLDGWVFAAPSVLPLKNGSDPESRLLGLLDLDRFELLPQEHNYIAAEVLFLRFENGVEYGLNWGISPFMNDILVLDAMARSGKSEQVFMLIKEIYRRARLGSARWKIGKRSVYRKLDLGLLPHESGLNSAEFLKIYFYIGPGGTVKITSKKKYWSAHAF